MNVSLRLSAVTLTTIAVLVLQGCATSAPVDETANWSPNKLYREATDERQAGNYEKAATLLEKLEGRAAGTPLAQQAQLDKAYTHFKAGEQAQALAAWTGSSGCTPPARPWTTPCTCAVW